MVRCDGMTSERYFAVRDEHLSEGATYQELGHEGTLTEAHPGTTGSKNTGRRILARWVIRVLRRK